MAHKGFILLILSLLVIVFLGFWGCKKETTTVMATVKDTIINGQRILTFSGYSWLVENSADMAEGPGPNYFSDSKENVWFDQNGKLHLKITNRNNKWYCAKKKDRFRQHPGTFILLTISRQYHTAMAL